MPNKEEIFKEYQDSSGKVSELIRNLALAGFAVIWIFKNPDDSSKILDARLIWALIFFVACLFFDLSHYFSRTIIIHSLYKSIKKGNESKEYPAYLRKLH